MLKKYLKWILLLVVLAGIAFIGYRYWRERQSRLPEGIFQGNGRVEAKLVDVVAKEPLRVKQILAEEGDLVNPGQVLVYLDTVTLEADLRSAKLTVAATQESEAITRATIVRRKSEIELARIEAERARKLLEQSAGSQREYEARRTALETNTAALAEEEARLRTVQQQVEVAQANVATIQTRIDDATLRSPVRGRVLYRLAEVGEVLGAGGKALTLVNLEDVYMEIFLPAQEASRIKIGADSRLAFDHAPGVVIPGRVSFVSPEAQFTPKQVETKSEREKLMFRVKIQVPGELVSHYIQNVKTGIRGVGYVRANPSVEWPVWLQNVITAPKEAETRPTTRATQTQPATRPALPGPAAGVVW